MQDIDWSKVTLVDSDEEARPAEDACRGHIVGNKRVWSTPEELKQYVTVPQGRYGKRIRVVHNDYDRIRTRRIKLTAGTMNKLCGELTAISEFRSYSGEDATCLTGQDGCILMGRGATSLSKETCKGAEGELKGESHFLRALI